MHPPAGTEAGFSRLRGARAQELAVVDVRVIDVEQSTEEPDDLDGRHEPLRSAAPPPVLRGSAGATPGSPSESSLLTDRLLFAGNDHDERSRCAIIHLLERM